jgi:hypothetical protein
MSQIELLKIDEGNPLDVAYIAGLFDGEGSVYISNTNRSYIVRASIAMKDKTAIIKCNEVFLGKVYIKRQRAPYEPLFHWLLVGQSAISFLKAIQPFALTKAESIKIVLEFYDQYWLPGERNIFSPRREALGKEYRTKLSNHQSRKLKV